MPRQYYSARRNPGTLDLTGLYGKLQNLFLLFRDRDYFRGKAGITKEKYPDAIKHEAALAFDFDMFPIKHWSEQDITEDHIFDAIEFLFDHVSKPGEWVSMTTDTGWNYYDYDTYDVEAGRLEFREKANLFLAHYKSGYELTPEGILVHLGNSGLQYILNVGIIPYDEVNVDSKIRKAITKWRARHSGLAEKRDAIRDLADVFEWLKKTKRLPMVVNHKDEAAIFDIANNFAVRHHNPNQKTNYDRDIWYSWIFHFYLATYHAVVRLLIKRSM